MPKKIAPAPKGQPADQPIERIRAAATKLDEIGRSIRDVVRDIDAANLALLDKDAIARIDDDSMVLPLDACDRVESTLAALTQAEDLAKDAAKESREAGKLAEHLAYGVRSLYREILARGEAERARRREQEAARQAQLFPSSVEVGHN